MLDGDARSFAAAIQAAAQRFNRVLSPLYLPGTQPPEDWLYSRLEERSAHYTQLLGAPGLALKLANIRQAFENAVTSQPTSSRIASRSWRRLSAKRPESLAVPTHAREQCKVFVEELEQAIYTWRNKASV